MAHHLFLGIEDRRLYLIDDNILSRTVVVVGDRNCSTEASQIVDLRTELTLSVPKDILHGRTVPDEEIYPTLKSFRITGLRPVGPSEPELSQMPLAGNLRNPTWLSVFLHGVCDSKCGFCFTEFIRKDPGLPDYQVVNVLEAAYRMGVRQIVFTGGEPTLRKSLPALIEHARHLNYNQIQIQTNGHKLSDPSYVQALMTSGLSGALVSLHGPTAAHHDKITATENSFARAVQALRNLEAASIPFTINFVICNANGALSVQMVDLVKMHFPSARLRLSFLIIEGAAHNGSESNIPALPLFVNWADATIKHGKAVGVAVEVENVPPCVSARLGLPHAYTLSRRRTLLQASPFYVRRHYRGELDVKTSRCSECSLSADCAGLQMAYLANIPIDNNHVSPI